MPELSDCKQYFPPDTTIAPGRLAKEYPNGITEPNERIAVFRDSHQRWLLDYAEILADGKMLDALPYDTRQYIVGGSLYAVLVLLNAYIELIGRLCGPDEPGTPSDRLRSGLPLVFEELVSDPNCADVIEDYIHLFRNQVAHIGIPKSVLLYDHVPDPLNWCRLDGYDRWFFIMNVRALRRHIAEYFHRYIERILNPQSAEDALLRDYFLDRIDKVK